MPPEPRNAEQAAPGLHMHKVTLLTDDNKLRELEAAVKRIRQLGAPDYAHFRHEERCIVFEWGDTLSE